MLYAPEDLKMNLIVFLLEFFYATEVVASWSAPAPQLPSMPVRSRMLVHTSTANQLLEVNASASLYSN